MESMEKGTVCNHSEHNGIWNMNDDQMCSSTISDCYSIYAWLPVLVMLEILSDLGQIRRAWRTKLVPLDVVYRLPLMDVPETRCPFTRPFL